MAQPAALGTWDLGVDYLGARTPAYRSSLFVAQPAVYASDRDNSRGADLTPYVTAGSVDADIDRQGGKSQCELTVYDANQLAAWDWVRTELTVIPEVGNVATAQLGLFRLEQPSLENIGDGARDASATGVDVVTALLEQTVLTAPLTIPPLVNVTRVVRMLTELAGRPPQAPNMVSNPTFGSTATGWSNGHTPSYAGAWSPTTGRSWVPGGAIKFVADSGGATAAGGYGYVTSDTHAPIEPGVARLRLTAKAFCEDGRSRVVPVIYWYDASDTLISATVGTVDPAMPVGEWYAVVLAADVPAGAVTAQASARVVAQAVGAGGQTWVDDVWLGEDRPGGLTRHAYPATSRTTGKWRTLPANTSVLAGINDLLSAIGCFAASATGDGQPTSQPYRDLAADTPVRTYTVGLDSAITGSLRVERAAGNLYNVVVLTKDDFQTKTSIQGVARNDDPNHPWSTVNIGERPYTGQATISQEADQAALDAQAAWILRRASVTESIELTLLPDPQLTVHDVIELTGANGPEDGRWAIERIAWSLDPSDPLMTVTARRTTVATAAAQEAAAA